MTRDLPAILHGGYCTRWHANSDLAHIRETLAEHHARVAQIILALHPCPSVALLDAALHHDAAEASCGDLPWPYKRANPEAAAIHAQFERRELERMGCAIDLPANDARWFKFADSLAAIAHVAKVAPHLLCRSDWREDIAAVIETGQDLIGHRIGAIIEAITGEA